MVWVYFPILQREKRYELYEEFFKITVKINFSIIASSISKKTLVESDHDWNPLVVGFESIMRHYDRFLNGYETNGIRIIDDKGKPNEEIIGIDKRIMKEGIDLPSKTIITKIILEPLFLQSKRNNLLQFSDMVVFTILRNEVGLLYKKSQKHNFFKKLFNDYLQDKLFFLYKYPQYP